MKSHIFNYIATDYSSALSFLCSIFLIQFSYTFELNGWNYFRLVVIFIREIVRFILLYILPTTPFVCWFNQNENININLC
jgi:hypothetical protein